MRWVHIGPPEMDKKYGNSEGDAIYNEIIAVGAANAC
jgi:hypothetical protein